jgi:hypothetical protein
MRIPTYHAFMVGRAPSPAADPLVRLLQAGQEHT